MTEFSTPMSGYSPAAQPSRRTFVKGLAMGGAVAGLDVHDALSIWIAPHLFRVLGLGLIVQNLSPGLSA